MLIKDTSLAKSLLLKNLSLVLAMGLLISSPLAAQIGYVDGPANLDVSSGSLTFLGWALDTSTSVESVEMIIDGVRFGLATYGSNRQDVCDALGYYSGCPNVGWSFVFDTHQVPDGHHMLNVRLTTSDGRQSFLNRAFLTDNSNLGLSSHSLFTLVNRASGKVLDVTGGPNSVSPGAVIQQFGFLSAPNQMWRLYPTQDGFYSVQAVHSSKSISALDGLSDGS